MLDVSDKLKNEKDICIKKEKIWVRQAKSLVSCRQKKKKIRPRQSWASSLELNCTRVEVTRFVKLQGRRSQTATQVKVLSPEIFHIKEADGVHILEGSKSGFDKARTHFLFRGLSPRYEVSEETKGTWEILLSSRNGKLQTIWRGKNAVMDNRKSDWFVVKE